MIMKKKEKILLDITNDKCPITFVKTKIALEKLKPNQYLNIHIKKGIISPGVARVPSSYPASASNVGSGSCDGSCDIFN